MKIIQSFWTGKHNNIEYSFGWLSNEYHYLSWILSCNQLRKYYDEVELSYLNNTDEMLINQFNTDIIQYGFENAKYNLQNTILSLNLSDEQFNKYNNFINILMLLNNYDPNILIEGLNAGSITGRNAACGESIVAYSLATIGLAGCVVTGPFAPIVCGAAIASKVLAFRAMLRDCR